MNGRSETMDSTRINYQNNQ